MLGKGFDPTANTVDTAILLGKGFDPTASATQPQLLYDRGFTSVLWVKGLGKSRKMAV